MALTTKFKTTLGVGAGVIVAAGLVTNQAVQQKQITLLQDQVSNQATVEKVMLPSPTATPTATLTPTIVPAYKLKVAVPTRKVLP